ncbi:MAG: HAMP domain-containing histidine kinase [Micrococcales bacterium]|nr:HAMP domain-containing histidine kinase [Micrococcales bacterium]
MTFGLLAGGLSVLLAVAAWIIVSQNLTSEHESEAALQAALNRSTVQSSLDEGRTGIETALPNPVRGGAALVLQDANWRSTAPQFGPSGLPPGMAAKVIQGARMVDGVTVAGVTYTVAGLPLQPPGAAYFEWTPTDALTRTLELLAAGLVVSALVTVALGVLLGRLATRLALRPLTELVQVAGRVAAGDLGARLPTSADPDVHALATSFNATIDQLQRRVATDARFALDVSHELRTPLTTMLNSVQVIRNRRDELPVAVREPLDLLTADVERFRVLVVDLLEFSRDDAGDRLQPEDVVIADLVRYAADHAAGRPITQVDDTARGVVMGVEKHRMERVITNLVDNAEAHGGGCVDVHVSRVLDGHGHDIVRILVDDTGPGIPEADRQRIFDRFARGDASGSPRRRETGTGLGLAIVERHVALHGGRVSVEDNAEGGARFVVELPVSGPRPSRRDRA